MRRDKNNEKACLRVTSKRVDKRTGGMERIGVKIRKGVCCDEHVRFANGTNRENSASADFSRARYPRFLASS